MPDEEIASLRESLGALSAQVADLRGKVVMFGAKVDKAGADGKLSLGEQLAAVRAEVSALSEALAEALEEESIAGPSAPYWLDMSEEEFEAALGKVIEWVTNMLIPGYPAYEIRACWVRHPDAVWELSTLFAEWRRIYDRKAPLLADALTFHDRWLPHVIERVAKATKDCKATCSRAAAGGERT